MRSSPFTLVIEPLTVTKLGDFRPKFFDEFTCQSRPSSLRLYSARIENVNDRTFVGSILPPMRELFRLGDVHAVLREQRFQKGWEVDRVVSFCAGTRGIIYGQVAATGLLAINHVAAPCRQAE
jgi:hypothetical protein